MKGLLIKDLKILGKQKKFLILILILAVMLPFSSSDTGFTTNYIILMLALLSLSTITYDEMNGGMMFLLSLPTSRKLYVKEKYVFAGLDLLFAAMVSSVTGYVAAVVKKTGIGFGDMFLGGMGTVCVVAVMLSVAIPLTLKFGAEKGRMIISMATIGVGFIVLSAYKIIVDVCHVDLVGGVAKLLGGIKSEAVLNAIIIGALLIVVLLILLCSYLVSNRVMRKKEF